MKTGIELMAEERARHPQEGWTTEHDDEHSHGEMRLAAICYAMSDSERELIRICHRRGQDDRLSQSWQTLLDFFWPFGREWWKPCPYDRVRELVKAGALLAAEIDRIQRLKTRGMK